MSSNPAEASEKNQSEKVVELKALYRQKAEEGDIIEMNEKMNEFLDLLKEKYPNDLLNKSQLYHVIIGSSFIEESSPDFDLPEGEIEAFIRNA